MVRAAAEGIQALHEETAVWHGRVQFIEKQRGGFRDQAHEMETLLATLDIKRNNLEERVEELLAAGMPAAEARRVADEEAVREVIEELVG